MRRRVIDIFLAVAAITFAGAISAMAQQPIELVTLENFAPFSWREGGEAKGIDVEITKELCLQAKIPCNIKAVPWTRVLYDVENGLSDGGFAAYKLPEREVYSIYMDYPLNHITFVIFVKQGNEFPFNGVKDLFGKRIGKVRGFSVSDEFDKAEKENYISITEVGSIEQNIKMLLFGRIDGFVGSLYEASYAMKNMPVASLIVSLPKPIRIPRPTYLIISKAVSIKNKMGLITRLNSVLKKMLDDGTVEKIIAKHIH